MKTVLIDSLSIFLYCLNLTSFVDVDLIDKKAK